jgi:hypothetical protein
MRCTILSPLPELGVVTPYFLAVRDTVANIKRIHVVCSRHGSIAEMPGELPG